MASGIFFQSPAILMVPFNAVVVSFQTIFSAFNRYSESQSSYISKEFLEPFFIVFKLIASKIKFIAFLFCFQKLTMATFLYISVNFFYALLIAPPSRRESINSKFSFPVFAYPSINFYFFLFY